jgi:riboflavin kinase/FMN adenylyltransferase
MVEGVNFRFGAKRAGTPTLLRQLGDEMGIEVHIVDLLTVALRDKTLVDVSSTLVRWLVRHGRIADVTLCLRRNLSLRGEVVVGEQRGRVMGVPTANLNCGEQMMPLDGVYAGWTMVDGQRHAAAISIGSKPTFGPHGLTCEAHLLNYDGDLYGRVIEVHLQRWLREQLTYPTMEALKRQMQHDLAQVVQLYEADLLDAAALAPKRDLPVLADSPAGEGS